MDVYKGIHEIASAIISFFLPIPIIIKGTINNTDLGKLICNTYRTTININSMKYMHQKYNLLYFTIFICFLPSNFLMEELPNLLIFYSTRQDLPPPSQYNERKSFFQNILVHLFHKNRLLTEESLH